MNFFGKKSTKKTQGKEPPLQEYKPYDFSAPDAFSEENMAKMGGVDTIAFDENDPSLMAELAELGWDDGGAAGGGGSSSARGTSAAKVAKLPAGHRPLPASSDRHDSGLGSGPPGRGQSGNDLLRSLGLSLNSLGEPELTEEDLQDPDLLDELGEVSGDTNFANAGSQRRPSAGGARSERGGAGVGGGGRGGGRGYDNDEDEDDDDGSVVEADRESDDDGADLEEEPVRTKLPALPPRGPSAATTTASASSSGGGARAIEIAKLTKEVEGLHQRAVDLKKAGDQSGALEAMRAARSADHELSVLRTLSTATKVATVTTEYVTPEPPAPTAAAVEQEVAPTPSPAGAGAGGGGGKPVSAELVMKQVKILYQRAVELRKEGRTAEAMACLKRAKSLEADLLRDAHGKGLVTPGERGEAGEGRRPSMNRQGSSRLARGLGETGFAGGAGGGTPQDAVARKGSRSGSQPGLPPSVKEAMKPKVFPAERDDFSDLEDALAGAIQLHMDRAKSLVKRDRAAAAKEVKRYKELQSKLDLAREMRVVPGARPPPWQWKITKKSRVRVLEQVAMDQIEFEISRIHGLTEKTGNKGSVWVKYDLGYSKDEKTGKGFTHSCRADTDTVEVDFKVSCYVKRARSTQMAFQNRRITLELFHKKSLVSGAKFLGKCLVPLQPLLSCCEMDASSPILTEGRREAGGSIELSLKLRKPISSDEVVVTEEKELEVGEWPPVSTAPLAPTAAHAPAQASAPAAAPAAAAAAPAPAPAAASAAASGGSGAGAADRVQPAAAFQNVVLTETEMSDPFAVENLDSNNVLEAEIEAVSAKAATGDLPAVMRKGALETKLLMLVSAVQSGELDLPAYCDILRERVVRDKVLAIYLKGQKRMKEAVAVMKRMHAMEEELAGVPQEDAGGEEEAA